MPSVTIEMAVAIAAYEEHTEAGADSVQALTAARLRLADLYPLLEPEDIARAVFVATAGDRKDMPTC